MVNSVNPLFLLVYLNSPVMFDNYLQQTISADDIFRCIFLGTLRVFLGTLRVNKNTE